MLCDILKSQFTNPTKIKESQRANLPRKVSASFIANLPSRRKVSSSKVVSSIRLVVLRTLRIPFSKSSKSNCAPRADKTPENAALFGPSQSNCPPQGCQAPSTKSHDCCCTNWALRGQQSRQSSRSKEERNTLAAIHCRKLAHLKNVYSRSGLEG